MLNLIYNQGKYFESKGLLPPFGYSLFNVTRYIELIDDEVIVINIPKGEQKLLRPYILKGSGEPKAKLIAEDVGYVFGLTKTKPEQKQKAYQNLLNKAIADNLCVDYFQSILNFLANKDLVEQVIKENNINEQDVIEFEVDGFKPILEVKEWWEEYLKTNFMGTEKGQCLVTGKIEPLIKVGGKIKGVPNTLQNTGTILTANQDSCSAYGLKKSNATPVSVEADYVITSTINYMINEEGYRIRTKDDITLLLIDNDNLAQSHVKQLAEFDIRLSDNYYAEDCKQFQEMWHEFNHRTEKASFENAELSLVTLLGNSGRIALKDYHHLKADNLQTNFKRWFNAQEKAIATYTTSNKPNGYRCHWQLIKGCFPEGLDSKHGLRKHLVRDLFQTMFFAKPISNRIKSMTLNRITKEATNNNYTEYFRSILIGLMDEYNKLGETTKEQFSYLQGELWAYFTMIEADNLSDLTTGNGAKMKAKAMESFNSIAFQFAGKAIEQFDYVKNGKTWWLNKYEQKSHEINQFIINHLEHPPKGRRNTDEGIAFERGYRGTVSQRFTKQS